MYSSTTNDIRVTVQPEFLAGKSNPSARRYVWAYRIEIANLGKSRVQLRSRHWRITDGLGRLEEVKGAGVVGEEPVLEPGQAFTYASGCPLSTSSGIMVGTFHMQRPDGSMFDVAVPAFSLDSPYDERRVN